MTIKVSRDSGKTYAGEVVYSVKKEAPPPLEASSAWPPCKCYLCIARRRK